MGHESLDSMDSLEIKDRAGAFPHAADNIVRATMLLECRPLIHKSQLQRYCILLAKGRALDVSLQPILQLVLHSMLLQPQLSHSTRLPPSARQQLARSHHII